MGCFPKPKEKPVATQYRQLNKHPDPLFYDYNQCQNINHATSDPSEATKIMRYLSQVCVQLIEDKQPLCDDILVLCYNYCKDHDHEQSRKIRAVLQNAIRECLADNIDLRSKEWFKHFILKSNVLLLDKLVSGEEDEMSLTKPFVEKMNDTEKKAATLIEKKFEELTQDGTMDQYYLRKLINYQCKCVSRMTAGITLLRQDRIDQVEGIKQEIPMIENIIPDTDESSLNKVYAKTSELFQVC